MQTVTAGPCTQVQGLIKGDWTESMKMMKHLNEMRESVLISSAKNLKCIKQCVDAAFAAHPDHKSHTGAMMTVGKGGVIKICP